MGEFLFLGGASFALFPVLVLLAVVVVLALRHDDDAGEERAPAIYGSVVAFLALLTLLVAVTAAVGALVGFTEDTGGTVADDRFTSMMDEGDHDDDWRALAASVIAGGAAVAVLALHRPLLDRRDELTGAARRVYRAYLALMSLVTVVLAVAVGAVIVYAVLRLLSPGVFGGEDRGQVGREALPLLALFLGAATLWRWHWARLWSPPQEAGDVSAAASP